MLGQRLLWAAAFAACGVVGCFAQDEAAPPSPQETSPASAEVDAKPSPEAGRRLAAQNRLASRLLQELEKQGPAGENIVVSPASVAMALSLLELGADRKLRLAIAQALGYNASASNVAPGGRRPATKPSQVMRSADNPPDGLKDLLQVILDLDADKSMEGVLALANSIIFDPQASPSDLAVRGLRETRAKVAIEKLSSEEALRGINEWVSAKTNGLIPTILETPPVAGGLVALNALYFKDKWKLPFEVSNTKSARFHGVAGDLNVPMMSMSRHLHQVQTNERFVGIELPYMHERFAMVLVSTKEKPARVSEFGPVMNWLAGDGFTSGQVELAMPRFQLNGKVELLPALDALGLKTARASPTALQGFSPVPQRISQITQRTYLQVDEAGTEAAAATAVLTVRSAFRTEKISIDKAFLFALRDRVSGLILMAGYVGSPSAGPVAELAR
jgi:serine protease inhibitor